MITLQPYELALLSGLNREGRRRLYKKDHKSHKWGSWIEFNSHPKIWKQKPIRKEAI
jgi:hypothetical protein